ncbi:high-affinity iron permease [Ceratobasidium sp. 414]|nr:high-affinity iron permease [Ceratobasidium sp. 414]
MAKDLFSLLRESLEASIIVSVLLSLVEQIANSPNIPKSTSTDRLATAAAPPAQCDAPGSSTGPGSGTHTPNSQAKDAAHSHGQPAPVASDASAGAADTGGAGEMRQTELLRRLRWQIILGAGLGFLLALVIGAAFIAVWFIKVVDLFSAAEEIWEGVFGLIASILILVMGLAMLRMDRAKAKWKGKLEQAFNAQNNNASYHNQGRAGIRMLFMLPFVTVLREGLEAVVFVGGDNQQAQYLSLLSLGLLLACSWDILFMPPRQEHVCCICTPSPGLLFNELYIRTFRLPCSLNFIASSHRRRFTLQIGRRVRETSVQRNGSYDVVGNIWHLDCCNPENKHDAKGWAVFNAILGWSNNGSLGTVLSYILYWLIAIVALVKMKHREGRTNIIEKAAHYTRFSAFRNAIQRRQAIVQGRSQSQEITP